MTNESVVHPARLTGLERGLTWALYATAGWMVFLALTIAVASKGVVPDYDGLAYLSAALHVNIGFARGDWMLLFNQAVERQPWLGLPFTNTLDVLLLGLLYTLVDYHIGIWLIHTAYVVVFLVLLRRVLDVTTTALIFLWAISHALFLHQYTQFISEMKVGMFLIVFTVYLFQGQTKRRSGTLIFVTILLLLLRVINILLVLPISAAYAAIQWRRGWRWKEIFAGLKPIGWAFLIVSPLLASEIKSAAIYMYNASYSDMAQNWRDMSGVTGKWSLFETYGGILLLLYQRELVIGALGVVAWGLALHATTAAARLAPFRNYMIAALVVFGVLMQAQSSNSMVAYWLYMFLGLSAAAVLVAVLKPVHAALIACLLVPVSLYVNYSSFARMNRSLVQQRPTVELATGLAQSVAAIAKPVIFQNYAGIGQLDFQGLEVAAQRLVGWPPVDNVSYNTSLAAYLEALESANVAFIANRNFMWPAYIGVNHKTEAIAKEVGSRAAELGLTKSTRLYFDSGSENYVDVYLRPTVTVRLKHARFDDHWLGQETTVTLGGLERQPLTGYVMELDLMVPVVDDPAFTLPLTVKLIAPDGQVVKSAVVNGAGPNTILYPLDGLLPGNYRMVFDKTFSPQNDPRRLSALFVDAKLKHVNASAANGGRAK